MSGEFAHFDRCVCVCVSTQQDKTKMHAQVLDQHVLPKCKTAVAQDVTERKPTNRIRFPDVQESCGTNLYKGLYNKYFCILLFFLSRHLKILESKRSVHNEFDLVFHLKILW